jgi:Dyp-type peroxidase family
MSVGQDLGSIPLRIRDSRASNKSKRDEPVLNAGNIQGNVLVGFGAAFQTFVFLAIKRHAAAKRWLRSTSEAVTSVETLLRYRRATHRRNGGAPPVWTNIAFSFAGLSKLADDAGEFADVAFKEDLHRRSWLLGDPTDRKDEGFCRNWVTGGPRNVADVFLIVASDDRDELEARVAQLEASVEPGLRVLFKDHGARLEGAHGPCEHFGFRDPISQPAIRGRFSDDPDDLLTPRAESAEPHQASSGQNLVWPGEFVFGYPQQNPLDLLRPGAVAMAGPAWSADGSFLVFRRLRQDVRLFRSYLEHTAAELRGKAPALETMTAEKLAAKFLGRWPSGAPLLRAPDSDDLEIAHNPSALVGFSYLKPLSSGGKRRARAPTHDAGDVDGLICPHAAHIRKAYPRDHATSLDTATSMETHRLLRRGLPFGPPFPAEGERGLLFLAYQTSIERQFEFVTRAWLNKPHLRDDGDGHDPVAGQRSYAVNGDRSRSFTLPFRNAAGSIEKVELRLPKDWVTPTGGGYFFAPSLSALTHLAEN